MKRILTYLMIIIAVLMVSGCHTYREKIITVTLSGELSEQNKAIDLFKDFSNKYSFELEESGTTNSCTTGFTASDGPHLIFFDSNLKGTSIFIIERGGIFSGPSFKRFYNGISKPYIHEFGMDAVSILNPK